MQDQMRAMLSRGTLVSTDDAGDYQRIKARGLAGEELDEVVRHQPFGFSSNPAAGAEGLLLRLGGRAERTVALMFEDKGSRPKNLPEKAVALYNADGTIWKLLPEKADLDHGGKNHHAHNVDRYKVEAATWAHLDGKAVFLGKGPWFPVMTTSGPSQHVFAGIGPAAPNPPAPADI